MSTSAGWDGVLNGIIDEEDCTKDNHETGEAGNCGNTAMGIAFLLSYLVIRCQCYKTLLSVIYGIS
jgi:voltage-gated sodium channel type II alpha